MKNVVVKNSNIDGNGVFANRDFLKGEVVIKWDVSHKLTKDEVDKLPKKEKIYIAFLDGEYILMQSPARYVNHSCNANTYSNNFCDIAKRDIKKGEEITGDYSENEIPGFSMKCNCKAKNCRRIISSKN